jgi:hypothetical protein
MNFLESSATIVTSSNVMGNLSNVVWDVVALTCFHKTDQASKFQNNSHLTFSVQTVAGKTGSSIVDSTKRVYPPEIKKPSSPPTPRHHYHQGILQTYCIRAPIVVQFSNNTLSFILWATANLLESIDDKCIQDGSVFSIKHHT